MWNEFRCGFLRRITNPLVSWLISVVGAIEDSSSRSLRRSPSAALEMVEGLFCWVERPRQSTSALHNRSSALLHPLPL